LHELATNNLLRVLFKKKKKNLNKSKNSALWENP